MDRTSDPTLTIAERTFLGGFSHVDAVPEAAALIAALDEQASLPAIQWLRTVAAEMLRPLLGARLLDVAAARARSSRALSRLVGAHGLVVGVEASATMVDEARRRTGDGNRRVEFRAGDIGRLDFEDATFDGVGCERMFQDAGVRQPVVVAETSTSTDGGRPTRPPFTAMAAAAERAGVLNADEAQTWLAQLADAGKRGQFFWALTMFAVAGTRPSPSRRPARQNRDIQWRGNNP